MVTREAMPKSCWGGKDYVQIYMRADNPGKWTPTRVTHIVIQHEPKLHVGTTIRSEGPEVLADLMQEYPHLPVYASDAMASARCLMLAAHATGRETQYRRINAYHATMFVTGQ